jgi:hypothetical protein
VAFLSGSAAFFHITAGTARFSEQIILKEMLILIFSTILSEIFFILKRI